MFFALLRAKMTVFDRQVKVDRQIKLDRQINVDEGVALYA